MRINGYSIFLYGQTGGLRYESAKTYAKKCADAFSHLRFSSPQANAVEEENDSQGSHKTDPSYQGLEER